MQKDPKQTGQANRINFQLSRERERERERETFFITYIYIHIHILYTESWSKLVLMRGAD